MKKTCNTCKYFYTKGGYTGKCEADDYNEFMTTQEACDIYEDKDNEEEYRFPTDEEFKRELQVSNYLMRKMAISIGLSEKEAESPSKCGATIGNKMFECLKEGMDSAKQDMKKIDVKNIVNRKERRDIKFRKEIDTKLNNIEEKYTQLAIIAKQSPSLSFYYGDKINNNSFSLQEKIIFIDRMEHNYNLKFIDGKYEGNIFSKKVK